MPNRDVQSGARKRETGSWLQPLSGPIPQRCFPGASAQAERNVNLAPARLPAVVGQC
jgi:hypothetical protein